MIHNTLIFGGSFDPFHNGHLHVIGSALDAIRTQQLLVVPNYQNPQKNKTKLDATQRFNLLQSCVPNLIKAKLAPTKVHILDIEIKKNTACYSVDTIKEIRKDFESRHYYFLMGSDSFFKLHTWKDYQELLSMCRLCVVRRCNSDIQAYKAYLKDHLAVATQGIIITGNSPHEASSTKFRESNDSQNLPDTVRIFLDKLGESKP